MPPAKSACARSDTCTDDPVIAIIGLDGATWDLAGPFLEAGEHAVLAALRRPGARGAAFDDSAGDVPAWSSFMTGTNPGKHGIFDFTRRVPGTYEVAFVGSRDRRCRRCGSCSPMRAGASR
jgi:predicted AlkP superfamily phosphohydrolase/phosphomutase